MELTYGTYLHIPELLDLQEPLSKPEEHDEMLFIIVHQVYELWFKQLLHESAKIKMDFSENRPFGAIHTFKRSRTILKTLVGQLDILETMTPLSFVAFRDRLDRASGFQSMQFRELEFAFGWKRTDVLKHYREDLLGLDRVLKRMRERSVPDHFYDFLEHHGVEVPEELKTRDVTLPHVANETVQDGLYELFQTEPHLRILFELMLDFDEGQQEWRYRHVKLVERTVGNKGGTGGSKGVEFLKKTLFVPFFPDLWAIRHRM